MTTVYAVYDEKNVFIDVFKTQEAAIGVKDKLTREKVEADLLVSKGCDLNKCSGNALDSAGNILDSQVKEAAKYLLGITKDVIDNAVIGSTAYSVVLKTLS